ncbi:hypothetical protein [Rugamonas apoptosis]|uniref:Single-stranded DNA-binding protein n=1 Tax=Rugamonas apoptosis TaxID=2758570 RepID=A0A7W2F8V0_9BURK|nr:hypothetical protein [Rugamonas apoptosis]MBA5687247.1 hypothetical protein [Rugamonas apoptosis]
MKSTIQILHVVQNAGRSKKTGNDYDMRLAQCIVQKVNRDTGEISPLIGELLLPQQYKDIQPGTYEVEFEVSISSEKRVGSQVATITPIGAAPAKASAPSAQAAKAA